MYKLIFLFSILITNLFADYKLFENDKILTVKIKDKEYKDILLNLKNEINHQSYKIVNELNLAKVTNIVADIFNRKKVLKNGKNILICKTSFTLEMIEENIHNITYCPLSISVYQKESIIYISYKKYFPFEENHKIAANINEKLKTLIINSLN